MMNIEISSRIEEVIKYGSLYVAFAKNYISPTSVLEWLATKDVTTETLIAYIAVCSKIHPDNQYLADGCHFIAKKPIYCYIALEAQLNIEIMDDNIKSDNPIIAHLIESLEDIKTNSLLKQTLLLLIYGKGTSQFIKTNLQQCFAARNFSYVKNVTADEINGALLKSDWLQHVRYNTTLAKDIINRVKELSKVAPSYLSIVKDDYYKVAQKLYKEKKLFSLTQYELVIFNELFPSIVNPVFLTLDTLSSKIALLGNNIAGYLLGFPIQSFIPNDEQIITILSKLNKTTLQEHITMIKKYNPSSYMPVLPFEYKITHANTTDVIMEEIDNYLPFDIIAYIDGLYLYRFTRVEFKQIIESRKNPWTNDWLPESVLSTIKTRYEVANTLCLPECKTINELFDSLEDGDFIKAKEEEVEEEDVPQNNFNSFMRLMVNTFAITDNNMMNQNDDDSLPPLVNDEIMQEVD